MLLSADEPRKKPTDHPAEDATCQGNCSMAVTLAMHLKK